MSPGVALLAAASVTWLLRVVFVVVLPVEEPPDGVQRALGAVGSAALAALAASSFADALATGPALPVVAATGAAVTVARWHGGLVLTVLAGVVVHALVAGATG